MILVLRSFQALHSAAYNNIFEPLGFLEHHLLRSSSQSRQIVVDSNSFSFYFKQVRQGATVEAMVIDSILSSPHRRSPSFRKQKEDSLSWPVLLQRHRFLLTALVLLGFLCTIYLYFAVTLGSESCSGLTGAQKASCRLEHAKSTLAKGKMKIL